MQKSFKERIAYLRMENVLDRDENVQVKKVFENLHSFILEQENKKAN